MNGAPPHRVGKLVGLGLILVALASAGGGCSGKSMLGAELDTGLTQVDGAIGRGDIEDACAKLRVALPGLGRWAEGTRGERAARANAVFEQIALAAASCGPEAPPGATASLAAAWTPAYTELREISEYKTSWLTVFKYASMLAVGILVYVFLRRLRS